MSPEFWAMVGVVLPVLIVQIFQYLATMKSAKKLETSREEIKAQVATVSAQVLENTEITQGVNVAAVRSQEEVMQAFVAGKRSGYEEGIPEGKRQATGPAPLRTDFGDLRE